MHKPGMELQVFLTTHIYWNIKVYPGRTGYIAYFYFMHFIVIKNCIFTDIARRCYVRNSGEGEIVM